MITYFRSLSIKATPNLTHYFISVYHLYPLLPSKLLLKYYYFFYYAPRPAERSEAGRGAFLFWDYLMMYAHIGSGK